MSRAAESVTRITNSINKSACSIHATGTHIGSKARIGQSVKDPGMKISQFAPLAMPDVSPPAVNARVPCKWITAHDTSRLADGRAHLAAVSDVPGIGRID